jgi:hypothetical protein
MDGEETIGAAEFKAPCLEILDQVAARAVARVTITKRGRSALIGRPVKGR